MAKQKTKTGNNALLPAGARTYYIVASKDKSIVSQIILGGLTRDLAMEAFDRYNGKKNAWKGKYGGKRDFKIVKTKLSRV